MEIIPELPNDTPVEQQSNFRDANNVTASPQASGVTANALAQPSESPVAIVSENGSRWRLLAGSRGVCAVARHRREGVR